MVWGLGWSALAIAVIIPHFNPAHHYMYWSDGGVISPGGGHIWPAACWPSSPGRWPVKLLTTALVLLPVVFLALRSPLAPVAVPGLALRFAVHQQQLLGHAVALQRHPDAHRLRGRDRRAGPHPGPGGQAPGPRGQRPPPGLPALEQGLGRQERGGGGQEPGPGRRVGDAAAPGPPGAAPPAHPASRPGGRVTRYAAVAMAAIAALLAFMFPLAGLWSPATYQVTPMSGPSARRSPWSRPGPRWNRR